MCMETTAGETFCRDYYVVFLDDCCATVYREEHEATLHNINGFLVSWLSQRTFSNVGQNRTNDSKRIRDYRLKGDSKVNFYPY